MESKKIQTSMQSLASEGKKVGGGDSSPSRSKRRELTIEKELYGYQYSAEKIKEKYKQMDQTFGNDPAKSNKSIKNKTIIQSQ
jgi:hypothetical protein